MLSHCANSECSRPFLQLGQGKLFMVETKYVATSEELATPPVSYARRRTRRVERYWLCDECARVSTLVHDQKHGVALMALPEPPLRSRPALREPQSETARLLCATSPAMRGAEAHAHGNVPGRVFECVENTRHSLRADLLRGAAQSQAGFDPSPIAENRSG